MDSGDYINALSARWLASSMEVFGHAHVLEEAACNVKIQLSISLASIYEEIDGENGLCVSREESG